jgi:F420-non-reducing hydrogenase large subunit
MVERISIDPITRLEGRGKIEIFLDERGAVRDCFFQVPELRGFEKFAEGRPVEEMPRITSRICGVCPEAHLTASAEAGDAVYGLEIPATAKKIREMQYTAFFLCDHLTHAAPITLLEPPTIMRPSACRSNVRQRA